jgi:hypothetical protein
MLRLRIEDHPGQRYELQRSADLTRWERVAGLENRTGVMFFIEPGPRSHGQRFYRLLLNP